MKGELPMNNTEILEFKIAKLKTYLNSFGGNSASVKMRTVAVKRKIHALEEELETLKSE